MDTNADAGGVTKALLQLNVVPLKMIAKAKFLNKMCL